MSTGNVIGKIEVVLGDVKIVAVDGTVRDAVYDALIYEGEQVISSDPEAMFQVKYSALPESTVYSGIFNLLADDSVAAGADESENVVKAGSDIFETAAGEEEADVADTEAGVDDLETEAGEEGLEANSQNIEENPEAIDYLQTFGRGDNDAVGFDGIPTLDEESFGDNPNDQPTIVVNPGNIEGENDTVNESGLSTGTDSSADTEFAYGTFTISDPDGLGDIVSVTINGIVIPIADLQGSSVSSAIGTLTITGYNSATGEGTYQYELTSNTTDVEGVTESDVFTLTVNDGVVDSEPAVITVEINDDVPKITVTADGEESSLQVDETNLLLNDTADFSGAFTSTPTPGADGQADVASLYTLGVSSQGVDSGLVDTATGDAVLLNLVGGVVVGSIDSGATQVFTVSVNSATGEVSLDQLRAMENPTPGASYDEAATTMADELITLTRTDTITDGDGDTASSYDTINIAANMTFLDDGPSISVVADGEESSLQVDETNLLLNDTADFSGAFTSTPTPGADGQADVASLYTLGVSSQGVDSGLVDTATGDAVLLNLVGGVVVGSIDSGATQVFTVSVNSATGEVSLDQLRAMENPTPGASYDEAATTMADELITLTRTDTITDGDGDTASSYDTINIAANMTFLDDGPSISVVADGEESSLQVDETNLLLNDTADFSGAFTSTPTPGADGQADVASLYTLGVSSQGVDSGLVDTATGDAVLLNLVGGVVVGSIDSGATQVFTVSVNSATGEVSLDQLRAMENPTPGASYDEAATTMADELITLTRTDTITDGDGDTASSYDTINIAANMTFLDDGPSISVVADGEESSLQVDETNLLLNDTADFSGAFTSTPTPGADGQADVASLYTLGVSSQGVDSGLVDTATGDAVLLNLVGGVVVGSIDSGATQVFTVSVNSATGEVSLDQLRAMENPTPGASYDEAATTMADELITLTRTDTITDGDGDTASSYDTINIAANMTFLDDGPKIVNPQDTILTNEIGNGLIDADLGINFGADDQSDITAAVVLKPQVNDDKFAVAIDGETPLTSTEIVDGEAGETYNLVYIQSGNGVVGAYKWMDLENPPVSDPSIGDEDVGELIFTITANTDANGYTGTYSVNIVGPMDGQSYFYEDIFASAVTNTGGNQDVMVFNLEDLYVAVTATVGSPDQNNISSVNYNAGSGGVGISAAGTITGAETLIINFSNQDVMDNFTLLNNGKYVYDGTSLNDLSVVQEEQVRVDAQGSAYVVTDVDIELAHFDSGESVYWEALDSQGNTVSSGTHYYDDGTTLSISSETGFSEIQLSAESGDFSVLGMYPKHITDIDAFDNTINVEVVATDGDADVVSDTFQVTFDDGDNVIEGNDSDESINYISGIEVDGGGGEDTLIVSSGTLDLSNISGIEVVQLGTNATVTGSTDGINAQDVINATGESNTLIIESLDDSITNQINIDETSLVQIENLVTPEGTYEQYTDGVATLLIDINEPIDVV